MFVLGGGVRDSGRKFLRLVNRAVNKKSFLPKRVRVVFGKVEESGVVGAGEEIPIYEGTGKKRRIVGYRRK